MEGGGEDGERRGGKNEKEGLGQRGWEVSFGFGMRVNEISGRRARRRCGFVEAWRG